LAEIPTDLFLIRSTQCGGIEMGKLADDVFPKKPGEIPEWMAIRDAENRRRKDNEARLRAARLARDASVASEKKANAPVRRKRRVKE